MWTERKPRLVVLGHICIKKCWQVATWVLTKLGFFNFFRFMFLIVTTFLSPQSPSEKSQKVIFKKVIFKKLLFVMNFLKT